LTRLAYGAGAFIQLKRINTTAVSAMASIVPCWLGPPRPRDCDLPQLGQTSSPISISLPQMLHFVISNFTGDLKQEPPALNREQQKTRGLHRGFVVCRIVSVQCARIASSNSATMLVILIIGFTAGPAVSL
jgi:hypothetical protein